MVSQRRVSCEAIGFVDRLRGALFAALAYVAIGPNLAFANCAFYGQVVVSSTQAGTFNTPALGSGVQGQLLNPDL